MRFRELWGSVVAGLVLMLVCVSVAYGEDLTVTVMDVGQADAILVQTAGKNVLIDAGEQKREVADKLRDKGIKRLDLVVGTHPHADHIGGMQAVITGFDVRNYMDNGFPHTSVMYEKLMEAAEDKVNAQEMKYLVGRRGNRINMGPEAYFEILWPDEKGLEGTRSDINSNSVVMRLMHGDVCFIFMGDAEEETEHLVAEQIDRKCQILKVSHHGSKHSSTEELLNKVQPEVALISCGLANKHGHPGQEILDRFASMGTSVFRTDLMGELVVNSDGKTFSVVSEHAPVQLNKININLADAGALRQLPGVGEKTAAQIIAYRTEHGAFQKEEDVLKVATNSMARKRIEKILPFITVTGGSTKSLIADAQETPSWPLVPSKLLVMPLRNHPNMRMVVPNLSRHVVKPLNAGGNPDGQAEPAQAKININTADEATLAKMPGMTVAKAKAAVEHRKAKGPFKSCKSLQDVKGIGKKTVDKLLSVCTVE